MDFITISLMIFCAALYGITMKIADLMNEHGLKWFRFSNLIFGAACGVFGALLILGDVIIANVILAMNIAFIIRRRIDYLNHAIALTIILITFLFYSTISPVLFFVFFIVFLAFGGLKDYVNDVMKKGSGLAFILTESMLYYPIPTLIYCIFFGNWVVFAVFLAYTIFYNAAKYCAMKSGYR